MLRRVFFEEKLFEPEYTPRAFGRSRISLSRFRDDGVGASLDRDDSETDRIYA